MINAVDLREAISTAYNKWNPSYSYVSGRYADGAIRSRSYQRYSAVGNFIAEITCDDGKEICMYYTAEHQRKYGFYEMAEWLSLATKYLDVRGIKVTEYNYDAFDLMNRSDRWLCYGHTIFSL